MSKAMTTSFDVVVREMYGPGAGVTYAGSFIDHTGKTRPRRPIRPAGAPLRGDHWPHTLDELIALAKQRDDCADEAEWIMGNWARHFGLTKDEAIDRLYADPEWAEWYPPEVYRP